MWISLFGKTSTPIIHISFSCSCYSFIFVWGFLLPLLDWKTVWYRDYYQVNFLTIYVGLHYYIAVYLGARYLYSYVSLLLCFFLLCIFVAVYLCLCVSMLLCIYVYMYLCCCVSMCLSMLQCIYVGLYLCWSVSMYKSILLYIVYWGVPPRLALRPPIPGTRCSLSARFVRQASELKEPYSLFHTVWHSLDVSCF